MDSQPSILQGLAALPALELPPPAEPKPKTRKRNDEQPKRRQTYKKPAAKKAKTKRIPDDDDVDDDEEFDEEVDTKNAYGPENHDGAASTAARNAASAGSAGSQGCTLTQTPSITASLPKKEENNINVYHQLLVTQKGHNPNIPTPPPTPPPQKKRTKKLSLPKTIT